MSVSFRPSSHSRWLFEVDNSSCWLTGSPTISSTGQLAFEIDVGFVLVFHPWLMASLAGKKLALDGVVSAFDGQLNEQQRYEFTSASVTSFGIPTLDAASNTPGHMTLTLQAKSVTSAPGTGQPATVPEPELPWRCSDFRLVIDKVNTSNVRRVDAIHVTIPGPFPKVNLLVPAIDVKQFLDWQKSGTHAPSRINFLAPDQAKVLFTLSFSSKVHSIAYSTNGGSSHGRKTSSRLMKVPVLLTATSPVLSKG
jgi:hypothetical protein